MTNNVSWIKNEILDFRNINFWFLHKKNIFTLFFTDFFFLNMVYIIIYLRTILSIPRFFNILGFKTYENKLLAKYFYFIIQKIKLIVKVNNNQNNSS